MSPGRMRLLKEIRVINELVTAVSNLENITVSSSSSEQQ
jgi:hypothetical protein